MDLKDFRTLIEIEKLGSISLAARSLYVSQPGLSQFLRGCEQQLGFHIFERVSHGVRPTIQGKAYLSLIHSVVEDYDSGMAKLRGDRPRRIRFGIGDQRGALLIPTIMSVLNSREMDFELEINDTISSRNNLLQALKDNVVDAACTTIVNEDYGILGDIRIFPLLKEEIMLVVPKHHPFIQKLHRQPDGEYRVDISDLHNQTFILCDAKREIRRMSDQIIRNLNISNVDVLQSSTSLFTVIHSCINCNALTFSPWEYICHSDQCVCASVGRKGVFWTHIVMAREAAFRPGELEMLLRILKESLAADMKNRHMITELNEKTGSPRK